MKIFKEYEPDNMWSSPGIPHYYTKAHANSKSDPRCNYELAKKDRENLTEIGFGDSPVGDVIHPIHFLWHCHLKNREDGEGMFDGDARKYGKEFQETYHLPVTGKN